MNISYNNIETRIISLKHRSDRRDLFKKLSDDDLDEFMNVLSNSFDLVRK